MTHKFTIEGQEDEMEFCILARIQDGLDPLVLQTEVSRMTTRFLENYAEDELPYDNYVQFYYHYPNEFLIHQMWARGVPRSSNEAAEKVSEIFISVLVTY